MLPRRDPVPHRTTQRLHERAARITRALRSGRAFGHRRTLAHLHVDLRRSLVTDLHAIPRDGIPVGDSNPAASAGVSIVIAAWISQIREDTLVA
jgi:hypothetical protein